MRILGIDYGTRRVGLAVSDPTGMLAGPVETITRRPGRRPPVHRVATVGKDLDVRAVVVGLPLGLDGEETEWCAETRAFGDAVARRLGVPVHYQDERLTSVMAERAVRESGLPRSRRQEKDRVDRAAAVLILQRWLDRRATAHPTPEDAS